jgi:hypothetical protein
MELLIAAIAMFVSLVSIFISVVIYYKGIHREQKQATLDAINVLQEQVFDKLNQYTFAEIREICNSWKRAIEEKQNKKETEQKGLSEEESQQREKYFEEYRKLSGYLARIEHFALGVNSEIYDANIAERAATSYLVMLYRGKLKPLIEVKHSGKGNTEYYAEFRKLIERIEKIKK